MFKKLTSKDETQVLDYLYQDPSINIFAIGDIENFGFDVDFQEVYAKLNPDHSYQSVLLRYRKNILYYSHTLSFDPDWMPIINTMNFDFVSGKKALIDLLLPYFPKFTQKLMYFCEVTPNEEAPIVDPRIIELQTKEQASLVFDLLRDIKEFDSMNNQTREGFIISKMESIKHSKCYYIMEDDICVSTVSTVADTTKSAMVVAVATHPEYRNRGYASLLMKQLLFEYSVVRKKSLCLFYDNPAAGAIYHRLGFVDKDMWTMLVRK